MKIRILNLFLIGSIVLSVMLSSCKKDDDADNPDYSQDKGEFKDSRDSKTYKWVKIGDQVWMAENLAYTGTDLKHITHNNEWVNNTDYDGWCYYENDPTYGNTYGVLYQWEAAKQACPDGWHLPNDAEWTKLEQFIKSDGHSGSEGAALKALTGWDNGGGGTDDYGFSALPGGRRLISDGTFHNMGSNGYWWSSTENNSSNAYYRHLSYDDANVNRYDDDKSYGFSVRCVKD